MPDLQPDTEPVFENETKPNRRQMALAVTLTLTLVLIMWGVGFNVLYAGKVLPGVSANGVYLGGLSRDKAMEALEARSQKYAAGASLPINYTGKQTLLEVKELELSYDTAHAAKLAEQFGRDGGLMNKLHAQLRSLLGRPTNFATPKINPAALAPKLSQIDNEVNLAAINAGFNFSAADVTTTPEQVGRRLDIGRLTLLINDRLSRTSEDAIKAPVYELRPTIETADLASAKQRAASYVGGPLEIKAANRQVVANPETIISWVSLYRRAPRDFAHTGDITQFYAAYGLVEVAIDDARIAAYVADFAKKVDQPGQDAALAITDGQATIFRPSRDGQKLDQSGAVKKIKEGLAQTGDKRSVTLDVKISKPAVTEDSLNNLGIKELLSEGISFFPGSTPARMQNVRTGAARYNGVLIKPGETFSFGARLGEVSAATGYAPAKVILDGRQEEQYGGGLCQVSSTMYRAALNAGLPIVQRQNHSFAVSYYTNPYGVPGVDATIYYPQVDFKFRNDTGQHILVQTIMSGTTLRFQFYGTKVKSGKIRGPFFVSGDSDAKKPSHTVFYRDVLDLAGNVTKTDTVHTHYQSSDDFPTTQQYN